MSNIITLTTGPVAPAMITQSGANAQFAWDEFFSGQLRNKHSRLAYLRAVRRFLAWVEPREAALSRITPGLVGAYMDELPLSTPSKKLHLSAVRRFFDILVQRHVVLINPALSVRTERYSAIEGKTPEISKEQARALLESIQPNAPIDFRDKALIATLIYTAARAGALARLRIRDLTDDGGAYSLRFHEKGGKHRVIPVRHDLQYLLLDYLSLIPEGNQERDSPFFRTVDPAGRLSERAVTGVDICRIVKRRLGAAALPMLISPHSFRSCTATDLLNQNVPIEEVQYLLGHSDMRVTRLYDRRQRQVTRNIVERISV